MVHEIKKNSDLDFTKNCIFINEVGFHINLRNNWAGKPATVKTTKIISYTNLDYVAVLKSAPTLRFG
jgi:hypothetical protein